MFWYVCYIFITLLTHIEDFTFFAGNVHDWEYGLFGFGYWVTILVMLSLGIVWGLVTISFTVFNIFGKPIETITGPLGLYLWNLLGCKYWFYELSTLFLQIYFKLIVLKYFLYMYHEIHRIYECIYNCFHLACLQILF